MGTARRRQPPRSALLAVDSDRCADVNTPANLRVINSANDTLARDVVVDADFANPLFGAAGDLAATTIIEDRRPIANQGRLRVMNGAGQFAALDFFLLPVGTPISSVQPLRVNVASSSSLFAVPPGTTS